MQRVRQQVNGLIIIVYLAALMLVSRCGNNSVTGRKSVTVAGVVTYENQPVSMRRFILLSPEKPTTIPTLSKKIPDTERRHLFILRAVRQTKRTGFTPYCDLYTALFGSFP